MAKEYSAFLKKNIDLAPLGMEKRSDNAPYFCTPKGATILGWAGVDGIHFCFVRGFGETVFAVSPMNSAPNYVRPLARNFNEFIRLLLACGDTAFLEQAWQWSQAQFCACVAENSLTGEQKSLLAEIEKKTGLKPMENPWQYITGLQAEFDYGKLRFTEEYYDLDMNPAAPQEPPAWKVYFDGNFWGYKSGQQAGKEIPIGVQFDWAGHCWVIPAAYSCAKGLVMDFCMKVEPEDIRSFMKKWDLDIETETSRKFTKEQRRQLDRDNPLSLDFRSAICLNGNELQNDHGCGITYNPCLPQGVEVEPEAKWVVEHYGLDAAFGWVIWRSCYPWATKRKPQVKSLSVTMKQRKMPFSGPRFCANAEGDVFSFIYPDGGTEYTLTVGECEAQTLDTRHMPQNMEYPTHFCAMSYTITPEPPEGMMNVVDSAEGDSPRPLKTNADGHDGVCAAGISVIGRAGSSIGLICAGTENDSRLHVACSALRFEPFDDVEWQVMFNEKQFEDITLDVMINKQ